MEKKQIIFQVNLVLHSRVCHLSIHSPHTHWGFYEVSLFTLYLKSRVRFYTRFAKPSYTTANTKITGSGPLWVVVCQTKSVMFYLDNPNLPTSFWKLHCVYPLMTTKWLKERLLHEVIFSRETKALIQTGFRERQTLWLPLGYLEAAELLFFSHNNVLHSTLNILDMYFHAHYSSKSDSPCHPCCKLQFTLMLAIFWKSFKTFW